MAITVETCLCQGCVGLRRRYKSDPQLLGFYYVQLLKRGWAGATDDVEKAYMASQATWYRSMQERGAELASQYPQPKRKAVTGEAPTAQKDAEASPAPAQLPLALAVP